MKAIIKLGTPAQTAVIVDGNNLTSAVGALHLSRQDGALDITASPGTFPTLELTMVLNDAFVSVDGELVINAQPVSDSVGRAIYQSLKERYEN